MLFTILQYIKNYRNKTENLFKSKPKNQVIIFPSFNEASVLHFQENVLRNLKDYYITLYNEEALRIGNHTKWSDVHAPEKNITILKALSDNITILSKTLDEVQKIISNNYIHKYKLHLGLNVMFDRKKIK